MGKDLKGKELGTGIRQKSDGIYSGRFVDRFGKRRELYDKNLTELKRKLNASLYEDSNGNNLINSTINISDWFQKWLEIHKYKVIRNNTKCYYIQFFRKHIEPVLGKKKLKDVTQLDVKLLINNLEMNGLKYKSQNMARTMLFDMFDKAMNDNFVIKNPCKGIKVIRDEKKDMRVFTQEEQAEFFDCSKGTFYDNLFVVAITTGLRQGELCGLTWEDIDLEKNEISVTKTLLYQKLEGDSGKTFHTNPPKTKTSNRKIPINRQCKIALKKQFIQRNNIMSKKSSKPLEGYENLLFTTKFGTPICDQIMIDAINKIIQEINLCRDELELFEYFTPHCFRHSFATRCFESGIQPKTVQHYLGHATLQMTMDLYTHVLGNQQQDDMLKLEDALDDVFNCGDETVEKRYDEEITNQKKVVNFNKGW